MAVSRLGYVWLAAVFGFSLLANHIPNENLREFFRMGYAAGGMFYFSVGVFIQQRRPKMLPDKWAIGCAAMGLALLAVKLVFAYHGWRFEIALGKISVVFLIYAVWHFMSAARWPNWLTSCSFPIFLMHTVVFTIASVLLKRLPIQGVALELVQYMLGITVPIVATVGLRRVAPRVAAIVFGGR